MRYQTLHYSVERAPYDITFYSSFTIKVSKGGGCASKSSIIYDTFFN
jgi:hypothetical protein